VSRRAGFTLLEVLVSLALMAIIAALAFGTLSGTIQARDLLEENDEIDRVSRLVMDRLSREISLAFLTENVSAVNSYRTVFVGRDNDDEDQLWFATRSHRRTYYNTHECDQTEITLWLEEDPENKSRMVLLHREAPRIDNYPDKDGVILPLARNVTRFDVSYLDPEKNEWKTEWDTTGVDTPNRLPRAVQVVFGLAGPDPDDDDPDAFKEYAFVKTIILETAPELKRSLLSGGGSGGGGPAPWGGM
jgi:prepilin-type N-terminal cleavage/methylation domain-containing protein